jgi:hypothetical protein
MNSRLGLVMMVSWATKFWCESITPFFWG